ncbi:MAG: DUF2298 domain-containing protein, partial [Acidobacteriota bacterium]
ARALGGSRRSAVMAAWLVVFAGTPDGWRQLAAGTSLAAIDLWGSSRAIAGAITEFPLFTFQLGDLHPHVLSVPLMLVVILLACRLRVAGGRPQAVLVLCGLLYGAAAAANPWCALPVGLAVLLAAIAGEERLSWPTGAGLEPWLRAAAVGALGVVLFLPFWLAYRAPVTRLGLVSTPSRWDELCLFMGGVLVPPLLLAWGLSWRLGGFDPRRRQLLRALWLASMTGLAAASGRVALALALGTGVVLAAGVAGGGHRRARPAWAVALAPLFLIGAMELVYVRDPYGAELYRMNTVFKTSHIAFTLLAVVGPVLLGWLRRRRPIVAGIAAVVLLTAGLPHFLALALRCGPPPAAGWSGLEWMRKEAEVARWLHRRPAGEALVEGVGDAYSEAARMASASGVPAALGWENHERVWRWGGDLGELSRRRALVEELYRCGSAARVREIASELRVQLIVLGAVERRLYGEDGLAAVRQAGRVAYAVAGCEIVCVDGVS